MSLSQNDSPYRVQEYKPKRRWEKIARLMAASAQRDDKAGIWPPRWEAIRNTAIDAVPVQWEAVITFRHPTTGKLTEDKRLTGARTAKAAIAWAKSRHAQVLKEAHNPTPVVVAKARIMTLAEWWPEFMQECIGRGLSDSYCASMQSSYDTWLQPHLGTLRLDQIDNKKRAALQLALRQRVGESRLANVLQALSAALVKAVEHDHIAAVPCKFGDVAKLKTTESDTEAPFYLHAQYAALIAAAGDLETETMILLGGDAGLRAGEICGLERSAISFERMEITVCKSIWFGVPAVKRQAWIAAGRPEDAKPKSEYVEKRPKHDKIRRVAMTPQLASALRKLLIRTRGERVFTQADGQWLHRGMVSKRLTVAEQAANLGRQSEGCVHVLRHTFCSHLALAGVSVRAIQELAGHHAVTVTQRYMHLAPNSKADAVAQLAAARAAETRAETKRTQVVTG